MTIDELLEKYSHCISDGKVSMNRKIVQDLRTPRGGYTDAQARIAIAIIGYSKGVWQALAKKKISVAALTEIYAARLIKPDKESQTGMLTLNRHAMNMHKTIKTINRQYPKGTFDEVTSLIIKIQSRLHEIEISKNGSK